MNRIRSHALCGLAAIGASLAAVPAISAQDWSGRPGGGEESIPEAVPLTEEERERYSRVARKLVMYVNDENEDEYRKLFTDEGWDQAFDWFKDMFAEQITHFGRIDRAYAPQRGMFKFGSATVGGDAGESGASFVVLFEDPAGGLISFELNDDDEIIHTSVYVSAALAVFDAGDEEPIYQLDPE